jgi:menaquinone-9 beta-reductase
MSASSTGTAASRNAKSFDALVIGGGPAGSTAALLLARAGWSVALLEKSSFPRGKVCGEFLSATNLPLLKHLGVAESFLSHAGPDVRQVGLFSGDHEVIAEMPRPRAADGLGNGWGRALGREFLDTLLLAQATAAGATVWQPWSAVQLAQGETGEYVCHAVNRETAQSPPQTIDLRARIVIAAHGSWEPGPLPTQIARPPARPSDLLGFKAHFIESALPSGLMPLIAFPGGYGGMVHSNNGRISLSFCIRRDQLEHTRRAAGLAKAGDALLAHIKKSCRSVREVLASAKLEGDWFAAGPIRPGIRRRGFNGIFLVGNAAGEAHPVVAEGIGMAMQSAWLLCERLTAASASVLSGHGVDPVTESYSSAWRQTLAPRIRAAALIAHWAMMPAAVAGSLPLLRLFPGVLTAGARLSGKATFVNRPLPVERSVSS